MISLLMSFSRLTNPKSIIFFWVLELDIYYSFSRYTFWWIYVFIEILLLRPKDT